MSQIHKDVITLNGQHFLVSTVQLDNPMLGLFDESHLLGTYETMVFPCSPDGQVEEYNHLFCDRYETHGDAVAGHARAVLTFQPPAFSEVV